LFLFLRLPQPGGPGSCNYFSQEQGIPIIPSGIEFFLLDFWIKANQNAVCLVPAYTISARTSQRTLFHCCCLRVTAH
jgi:hypothetical protein